MRPTPSLFWVPLIGMYSRLIVPNSFNLCQERCFSIGLLLAQELVHQPIKQPDKGSPNSGLCQHTDESVHGGMEPPCIPPLVTEQGSPDRKSTRGCMSYQAVDIPLCCLDF